MPEGTIEHPLSPSLPRDCGHECRVCKVTVSSLTDYAGHISSPTHKQNVEAAEQKHAGKDHEDYFDQALPGRVEQEAVGSGQVLWQSTESTALASSGGSSNGIYGQNNIAQYPHRGRPSGHFGPKPQYPPPPSFFTRALNQFQNTSNNEGGQQGDRLQKADGQTAESENSSCKITKNFGSNPKLDKACRWSPYPVTKGLESAPQKDTNLNPSEKCPKVPKPQKQEKAPESSAVNRLSRPIQKAGQLPSSGKTAEEKQGHKTNLKTKPRDRSSSGSRSSSAQREDQQTSAAPPSNQKVNMPLLHKDKKMSSPPGLHSGAQLGKSSSQGHAQPKSTSKQSGLGSKAPPVGPLKSRQERQLPEALRKERQIENRGSFDSSSNNRKEMSPHIVEEQQSDCVPGQNKENSCRQNAAKPHLPTRPEKPALQSSEGSQFLQSLQVSTSTAESSEPAAASREGENRRTVEEQTCSPAPDEAMQAAEAGQSSESDTSRSSEAPTLSGSNTSLSKLDLPPVLKRDLTKHISSKTGKTGSHEPNLNSARRVRNLSESRRSDTEKDSGLKPTVRQLISSSGSRRKVNWDQVYQEVRKKQDKGKGMPRFGIEMVSTEQEDQSQEEEDIPLLEGLHWDSLMDVSTPCATRKRSLSESSLAPESGSSVSPVFTQGSKDVRCQQEVDPVLGQFGAQAQKQPGKLTSAPVKALQRCDSVLGDSSSGTEQFDFQGTGKRRRADVPSPEASCAEHNNKRRKVKTKKERLQIDQLLAVSLREEELSRSLQTVDTGLIQARAALEAAYMEVQRLMVVKQQVRKNVLKNYLSSQLHITSHSPGLFETTETGIQTSCLIPVTDSKTSVKLLPMSRKGSEVDCAAAKSPEPPSVPSVFSIPASPSELSSGKRVRKLKKRKVLKKAQGTEQPESSDTEIDGELSRPRWLRPRRRPSGGSQVSTSTLPTDDREGDTMNVENSEQLQKEDRKSFMVELPHVPPAELTANLDSEESMEIFYLCLSALASTFLLCCLSLLMCVFSFLYLFFADASSDHGGDDMPTEGAFEGHLEAVNAMQIHNGLLYTCSGDRTVKAFDLVSRKCVGVFDGHTSKVSCLFVSAVPSLHHRLYSGSSDQTIRCYNLKTQELEHQFSLSDRVLCLHSRWRTLYAGLANGTVVTFNLKTNKQTDVFECHGPRAVSCLASTQEGARRILLVGSYDSSISVRDAKNGLLLRTLEGHTKTVLCLKVVNDLVFSGSSDQCVYTHNIHTGELVRVYKGHSHAVTVVTVLGKVMVTACLDKLVRVYDLQSHDQLQVYGGHKDMVMCMTVHKNMIYTGCYDGSVQAVKLNLMQNVRCWWHGCSLVFGVREHLQQHLIGDHTGANLQTLKCRWKNCEFFCARNSSKQAMLVHMRTHAEEETDLEP
uniref:Zinc finger protein 106 n=1 Tax=Scophthalmus maximus TaxID=52904 RepID=A0A8D3A8T9_SCOMX